MTAISNINYYHYWGKANKEGDYHLLAYHCLDVAAVAEAYLNTHPHFLNAIAFSLGFTSEQSKALILFMITLHDLGKFSICFQSKLPEILGQLLPSAKARDNTNYRHDELGQGIWLSDLVELFIQEYGIWEKDPKYINKGFNSLMSASTGHHGQPTLST